MFLLQNNCVYYHTYVYFKSYVRVFTVTGNCDLHHIIPGVGASCWLKISYSTKLPISGVAQSQAQEFDYLFIANLNAERAYQEIGFKTPSF